MLVLVRVLEALLVDVFVGVGHFVVRVLALVLDVLVIVIGVRVDVRHVAVLMLMSVRCFVGVG